MNKEKKFYDSLENIFVGAKIEGESGYVNLLKIKETFFRNVFLKLKHDIDANIIVNGSFKEEMFDKLFSFFEKYFSESGSVYFVKTANWQRVYERVYTDNRDVVLFWKTHVLYYVKSEVLYNSVFVEIPELKGSVFYFDISNLKSRKNNEKKELVFDLSKVEKKEMVDSDSKVEIKDLITFNVQYTERNRKTKIDDLVKELKISEKYITKAINVFMKQSEVDYFINKNAEIFLKEQLDLYLHQILLNEENIFNQDRLNQIKSLKGYASLIIDFISQFENELVLIWNKPKFVLNSNYVISLDKIPESMITKLEEHPNYDLQVEEWRAYGLLNEDLSLDIANFNTLYVDTQYFKELELDVLSLFDDLDESLDGILINSENYQALNTMRMSLKNKIDLIYIDPPFNTGKDFEYIDKYQDSTWLSIMYDRLLLAKDTLKNSGFLFLHLDHNASHYGRLLLNNIFGDENFRNDISWCYTGPSKAPNYFPRKHDNILFYSKSDSSKFVPQYIKHKSGIHNTGQVFGDMESEDPEKIEEMEKLGKRVEDWWNDIWTKDRYRSEEKFLETQKPEHLLRRIISSATETENRNTVMDFFAGSATTLATAHKMGNKWIGIEMSEYFYYKTLPRMKKVMCGDKAGVSEIEEFNGGGFFKYYNLEQYEDTLKKMRYSKDMQMDFFESGDLFDQYVFFADSKYADVLEVNDKRMLLSFNKLFENIDLAETLSNLLGFKIKKILKDKFILQDGSKELSFRTDFEKMSESEIMNFIMLIKPLIWWGK